MRNRASLLSGLFDLLKRKKGKKNIDRSWRDKEGFLHIGHTVICCRNGGTPLSENFGLSRGQ